MDNLKNKIIGLTIGIKYNRSFRVSDISGDIIDNILHGEKSPFNTNFFPKIQENPNREKTLFNKDSEYLRINTDDIILGVMVDNDFDKKFNWLKNDVLGYFQDELFKTYNIKNIRRLGIVFSHKINKNQKLTDLVSSITERKIREADNINISFSKKDPISESLFRKGLEDYSNKIYNFQEIKKAMHASLDYQYYYNPVIEDLRECFTDKVLDNAKSFLEDNFHKWLNEYEKKKNK